MTTVADIIESSLFSMTANGPEATRVFAVSDIGGDAPGRAYQATQVPGVPRYGDAHPSIPGIIVTSVRAAPASAQSTRQYLVSVQYSTPSDIEQVVATGENGPVSIELSTTVTEEQTRFDINGDLMSVTYSGPATIKSINPYTGEDSTVTANIRAYGYYPLTTYQVPRLQVSAKRIEPAIPRDAAGRFIASVNLRAWNGFPPKTWLCVGVNSQPSESGDTHQVQYDFLYAPETWRNRLVFKYLEQIPEQATFGNGIEEYDVYKAEDFNDLGVSF